MYMRWFLFLNKNLLLFKTYIYIYIYFKVRSIYYKKKRLFYAKRSQSNQLVQSRGVCVCVYLKFHRKFEVTRWTLRAVSLFINVSDFIYNKSQC